MLHGWINTILIGIMGLSMLSMERWRKLKWFIVYSLVLFFGTVIYLLIPQLQTYQVYSAKRSIDYLLLLLAARELIKHYFHSDWKLDLWFTLSLIPILVAFPFGVFVPRIQLPYVGYLLPRVVMFAGIAVISYRALSRKYHLLFAVSMFSAAVLISDIQKISGSPYLAWMYQVNFDLWVFTAYSVIGLYGIFYKEIVWLKSRFGLRVGSSTMVTTSGMKIETEVTFGSTLDDLLNLPVNRLPGSSDELQNLDNLLEFANRHIDVMHQDFLNPRELATYLGCGAEKTAEEFVTSLGVSKIVDKKDAEKWKVKRSHIDRIFDGS